MMYYKEGYAIFRRYVMSFRSLALILLVLLLSGCGGIQRVPFPENELAALNLHGNAEISGKLFLIDQFEEEQVGEEITVVLEPVSPYSDQWYEVKYLQDKSIAQADPRYEKYLKRVQTDKEGKYSISGIAPGDYLLTGTVIWKAITCSGNEARNEVLVSRKISVKPEDKELDIPLTKEFESPIEVCDLYNQSEWNKDDWEW